MAYTTIDDPSKYFHVRLYSGTGSSQAITNNANAGDFQPDWIWIKNRSDDAGHPIFDSSRGVNKNLTVNVDDAESTVTTQVTAFGSNGFTVGNNNGANGSSDNLVAFQWKCNGGTTSATVAEEDYALYSPANVRQTNTEAGFSIITYTGTGSAGQIQHGLGAVPAWIITKQRSNAENWAVYHHKNTAAAPTDYLLLNTTNSTTDNSNRWNDEAPNTNVFTVGSANEVNTDDRTYVAYVFAEKQGYSKFGTYEGNGNTDGTFVYTGFKPAWLMIKRSGGGGNAWGIYDSARAPNNEITMNIDADRADAENTATNYDDLDFLSNGFKLYELNDDINASDTYVYMAFAEHPFVSSKGVPTTAR